MRSTSASNGRLDKKSKKNEDTITKTTENTQEQTLDPVLKQKIQQLMDMTNCSQDNAIFALHDSDNDVNNAVNLLLESGNNMQGEWQEQKTKSKKKQVTQDADPVDDDAAGRSAADDFDNGWKENRSTERTSYPRNAPPRLQRGGRRPDYRPRDSATDSRDGSDRRMGGGERGRGRGRGGRGRGPPREGGFNRDGGGFNQRGGFNTRGGDSGGADQQEAGGPQIGTWTSEADANPKTDSWGDVWTEDNQWQGDLKSTHVFESSAKSADTFPTPTEFDPTAAAALPPSPPQKQQNGAGGGKTTTQQQQSLNMDTLFPKQTVETFKPPSVSIYDSQMASDSIKSAIGMPTQHSTVQSTEQNTKSSKSVSSAPSAAPGSQQPQRQPGSRQQRSKLPPPSTKIPTAPVEMPHTATTSMMEQLGVQFGTMDFTSDPGLSFDSSPLTGYSSSSSAVVSSAASSASQHAQQQSLYTPGDSVRSSSAASSGPEPIPFPTALSSQPSQAQTSSQPTQQPNSVPAQNNRTSTTQPQQQQSSNNHMYGSGFYQMQQQQSQDSRVSGSGYQVSSQSAGAAHQYTNSLYTSTSDPQSYNNYNSSVTSTSSLTAGVTSGPALGATRSNVTSKAPPNLPPPSASAGTPMVGIPGNFMMGAPGLPYYGQQPSFYSPEDMHKYQHMVNTNYYDMNQYPMQQQTSSTNPAFPGTGSGDGKMTRLDAQSPTVQGSQSNQSQSTVTNTQATHQQQYVSLPPGYHPSYYYPSAVMANPYGMFQMPTVTQNMSMPGNNSTGGYSSQKTGGSGSANSAANSYYAGTGGSGYDDSMSHSTDYNKGGYGASNKSSNLAAGSGSNTDISAMYKSNSSSQNNAVAAAMYGSSPGGYMSAHGQANTHMMPNQHLMPSQLGAGGQSQDSNVAGRGSQSMAKSHSKQNTYYSSGGWAN